MEDSSLDEFFESNSEGECEQDPDGKTADDTASGEGTDSSVTPAVTTARCVFAGESCERCETTTGRLWEDDGAFVCRDCKEW